MDSIGQSLGSLIAPIKMTATFARLRRVFGKTSIVGFLKSNPTDVKATIYFVLDCFVASRLAITMFKPDTALLSKDYCKY